MCVFVLGPLVGSGKNMRIEVCIRDLENADNMALVGDSIDTLEEILRVFDASCLGMGLTISSRKIEILAVRPMISSNTT